MARPPPETFGFLMADISRLMRRAYAQRLQASGSALTLAQTKVLRSAYRRARIPQLQLHELLDAQQGPLVVRTYHRIEAGLEERRADPADRRAYQLHLRP